MDNHLIGSWLFYHLGSKSVGNNKAGIVLNPPNEYGFAIFENGKIVPNYSETLHLNCNYDGYYKADVCSLHYSFDKQNWQHFAYKIYHNDTLILRSKNNYSVYLRNKYIPQKTDLFDEIVITTSMCEGNCPISSSYISQNGNYIFYGELYTQSDGLFYSKIPNKLVSYLDSTFSRMNFNQLEQNYISRYSDMQSINVLFVKKHKIVKTVKDYGQVSPELFRCSYMQAQEFYKLLPLTPLKNNWFTNTKCIYSLKENKPYYLNDEEFFLLFSELQFAKKYRQTFVPTYIIKLRHSTNKIMKILTDGRYFNINNVTFDLGYDFLNFHRLRP